MVLCPSVRNGVRWECLSALGLDGVVDIAADWPNRSALRRPAASQSLGCCLAFLETSNNHPYFICSVFLPTHLLYFALYRGLD